MNARWVILFAAVAQDLSFTRAAARLNLAQPWLSAQIRKLEQELGVNLFIREKNRIELTEEGRRLLPSAIQLSDAAQRFRMLARELGSDRGAVVRIGSHTAAMGVRPFAQLNDDFIARYATFDFEVQNSGTDALLEGIRGGALDIAMVLSPFDETGLEVLTLIEQGAYLLAPRTEPWASATKADAALLQGRVIATLPRERHPAFYEAHLAPLAAAGARLRPVLEPDGRAMRHSVESDGVPIVMIEGRGLSFEDHPTLINLPLDPPIMLRHCLVRSQSALAGRAADRYWRLAQAQIAARAADNKPVSS